MKKLIIIYSFLFCIVGGKLFGQITVNRTPVINFTNCSYQIIKYDVGIDPGNYGRIEMTEDFTAGGCNDCVKIEKHMPWVPEAQVDNTAKQVKLDIPPGNYSTTRNFVFYVRISGNNSGTNAGKYNECTICSDGPIVTCTTPTTIITTPTSRECVTLNNSNRWRSEIPNNCVVQKGLNCYRYPITIRGNACDGMNLEGGAIFDFNVSSGGVITNISHAGNHIVSTISNSGSNARFRSSPTGNIYNINQYYKVYIDVEYPCDLFPANNITNVTATLSNSITSWPLLGLTEMDKCPASIRPIGGNAISGTTITHTLDQLVTDATLNINRVYRVGHDAASCSNRYDINFCNTGNTILENIVITADPLPNNIQLTKACDTRISRFKVNNGAWQTGIPGTAIIAQVTGIEWELPELLPGVQCDTLPPRRCIPSPLNLCYTILPGTAVGTNINPCVTATFDQRVDCRAQNCTQPVPPPAFSLPMLDCHAFNVTNDESAPNISKTVSPGYGYPGDLLNFTITVSNCGSADLITQIQDNFPAPLGNVIITGYDRKHNGGAFQPGHGNWLTSPATISGNNVRADINIPGICSTTSNNSSCCTQVCNILRIHLQATINTCEQASVQQNTARLSPQTSNFATARFQIYNYNRLLMSKEAKGDLSSNFASNPTDVSPGGAIDYRIKVSNIEPKPWYNPVLVDFLPSTDSPSRTFCGRPITVSGFDVKLTGPIDPIMGLARDIDNSNAPGITSVNIEYGPTLSTFPSNITDPSSCGGTNIINNSYSTTNNRVVRLEFVGVLDCNDYLIINLPCEVMSPTASGIGNNIIFKTEKSSPSSNYGVTVSDNVDAQIIDWPPNCCDDTFTWARFSQIGHRVDHNSNRLVRADFQLQSPSPIPIQRIRASIIDFRYEQPLKDCFKCKNNFASLGTYPWWTAPDIGTLANVSNGTKPYSQHRERIWEGTPYDLSGGQNYYLYFQIPKPLDIPCCQGCITLCVKFEFTDVNCNTCEEVVCFSFNQEAPNPQAQPTQCSDIIDDPFNDPIDDSLPFPIDINLPNDGIQLNQNN